MKISWQDSEEIAIQLAEKYPDLDPLTLRFTELHKMVTELPDFEGDPKASNEGVLEAIQMAWLDEKS
jgi:FeS assembly protein IscX